MKKLAVLVVLSGACAVAHAADEGWVDGADANGASGWACDSAWPYHQENVHVYRDDGPFLGAIYAGNLREQAVADRCGGHPYHGFSGPLSYPSNLIDGKKHNVHFYFIRGDGSHFEIPGSPKKVQFGDPTPPFYPTSTSVCSTVANANPAPGHWILTEMRKRCNLGVYLGTYTRIYTFLDNIPSGYELMACEVPPSGWAIVGAYPKFNQCTPEGAESLAAWTGYKIRKN